MTITTAELDADLVDIIAEYPQAFTFDGTSYACAADDLTVGRRPVEAGVFGEDTVNIHVRTSLFSGARPAAGDTITYSGRTLRVLTAKTGPDDMLLTITCEEGTA